MILSWWVFLLLSLASYRVWKLLGEDTILDRPRRWVLKRLKGKMDLFLVCPWCSGFWICGIALLGYCIAEVWLGLWWFLVVWFAMSAMVGIIAHYTLEE